jgi:polysaccharide chain length determinant protein (PEP-CTERM system associated)
MHELIRQVVSALRGMWKHRWLGMLFAWVTALAGGAVVYKIPNRYEAAARIQVDTDSILKPLLAGLAVRPNVEQQVTMLSRTLISRPNVEKLVRMADLDLKSASKAESDTLVDHVMATLRITPTGTNNLYRLSYRDTDPERAKRAVQSLVSIFVETGLGASKKDAEGARAFINEQINNYRGKLEEAEARLKAFRLRNLDSQIGSDGKDITVRLGELSEQLEKARLELREAENARDAAKAALANERSQSSTLSTQSIFLEAGAGIVTPEIDARLDAQRRNLDALLQRFTDLHPEVIATRRLVKDLEEQRNAEIQALKRSAAAKQASAPASQSATSPVIQELNRMVAVAEVQVAPLKARVAEYTSRYNQARAQRKTAPQLEAEAAQLNRDYAIHKKNYEDLVGRRETAAISEEAEASGMADFRVIDPPRVAPQAVWPDRLMLLALVPLAALAAGCLAAVAAWQFRPVFFDISDLKSKLGLPVLGAVSSLKDAAAVRRQRFGMLGFATASTGLMLLFAVGLALMRTRGL